MKGYVIKQFGSPHVFQEIELPQPKVLPGHVLIKVMATSVNPVDYKIRAGFLEEISPDFPAVLHGDVAGIVEAIGEGVSQFQPGDEVYGCAGGVKGTGGALAEYMLADQALIALKPKSLSMKEAAALPLVSITAWEGLIDRATITEGDKVLIYGGTGGVGHIGLQLAKSKGAKTFVTVSDNKKMDLAYSLGADVVINYRNQSVEEYVAQYTNNQGFDLVFDTVGNEHLQNAFNAAAMNATIVTTLALCEQDLTLAHIKGLTLHVVFMLIPMLHGMGRSRHGQILSDLAQLVDEGKVRPLLDSKSFKFSEVAHAHQHAESGQVIGKVTLDQQIES